MDTETTLLRIRALNDAVRKCPYSGELFVTRGITDLPWHEQADILARVRTFDAFTEANDPHGEHDFGSFNQHGRTIFWKIDYYDLLLNNGSEDPSDPAATRRVLTVLLAEEY